ncbi:unnamed protein product [Leptosia nina]|uniref:Gustatory receptor n=1 Tax=Leptosia nina TaxID=320188 RepID=A0AAV1JG39_9NEOP
MEKPNSLNIVFLLCFALGHYYEYGTPNRTVKVLKIAYCVVFATLVSSYTILCTNTIFDFSTLSFFAELFITIINSMFSSRLTKFIHSAKLPSPGFLTRRIAPFILTLCVIIHIIELILYLEGLYVSYIYVWIIISKELGYLVSTVVLLIMYYQMKEVRLLFQYPYVTAPVIGQAQIPYKIRNAQKCLEAYKDLINRFEDIYTRLQVTAPSAIAILVLHFVGISLTVFTPAILSDMVRAEYKNIVDILRNQLATTKDESLWKKKRQIHTYLKYRPYRLNYLWREVPVNVDTIVGMFALLASHLIFVFQCAAYSAKNKKHL